MDLGRGGERMVGLSSGQEMPVRSRGMTEDDRRSIKRLVTRDGERLGERGARSTCQIAAAGAVRGGHVVWWRHAFMAQASKVVGF